MEQPRTQNWLKTKKRGKKPLFQGKYVNTKFQSECYLKPDGIHCYLAIKIFISIHNTFAIWF